MPSVVSEPPSFNCKLTTDRCFVGVGGRAQTRIWGSPVVRWPATEAQRRPAVFLKAVPTGTRERKALPSANGTERCHPGRLPPALPAQSDQARNLTPGTGSGGRASALGGGRHERQTQTRGQAVGVSPASLRGHRSGPDAGTGGLIRDLGLLPGIQAETERRGWG